MSISDLVPPVPPIKQEENDCGSSVEKWFKFFKLLNYLLRKNRNGDWDRKYLHKKFKLSFCIEHSIALGN